MCRWCGSSTVVRDCEMDNGRVGCSAAGTTWDLLVPKRDYLTGLLPTKVRLPYRRCRYANRPGRSAFY